MIILLQHTGTLDFLDSDGRWIRNRASACEFATAQDALLFCAARGLSGVQVFYEFPETGMNSTTPVSDDYLRRLRDRTSSQRGNNASGPSA